MGKKTILVVLDDDLYNDIHKLMGYVLVSDDIMVEKMHVGSNQDFYRRLMICGISKLKLEWEQKVKEYESKDDNTG